MKDITLSLLLNSFFAECSLETVFARSYLIYNLHRRTPVEEGLCINRKVIILREKTYQPRPEMRSFQLTQ